MDFTTDIAAFRNNAKLKAQGEAISGSLAAYFKLRPKVTIASSKPSLKTKENLLKLSKWQKEEMAIIYNYARCKCVSSSAEHEKVNKFCELL